MVSWTLHVPNNTSCVIHCSACEPISILCVITLLVFSQCILNHSYNVFFIIYACLSPVKVIKYICDCPAIVIFGFRQGLFWDVLEGALGSNYLPCIVLFPYGNVITQVRSRHTFKYTGSKKQSDPLLSLHQNARQKSHTGLCPIIVMEWTGWQCLVSKGMEL